MFLQDILDLEEVLRNDFLQLFASCKISGINTIQLFVGGTFSPFPSHMEDLRFGSFINVYSGEKVGTFSYIDTHNVN